MTPTLTAERAADLAVWASGLPPRAGQTAVVAIEGRSGAGKSVLAAAVINTLCTTPSSGLGKVPLVAMDGFYPGWDGLAAGADLLVARVLAPLAAGEPVHVPTWDWAAAAPGPSWPLPPTRLLVVEGIGCGSLAAAPYLSGLVWLEAADAVRKERALARDGDRYAPHWDRWAAQEDEYLRIHHPQQRASRIVKTDGPSTRSAGTFTG